MSSLPKVAVAGAGNLGIPIIVALVHSKKYAVTVLSRSEDAKSRYAKKLPTSDPNLSFAAVDYTSVSSLTVALKDHFAVVSTLGTFSVNEQQPLIEASVAAGVTRFFPSEFGSNTTNPTTAALPIFKAKMAVAEKLEELATQHPSFSYTLIINGPFFDWGLDHEIILDTKSRSGRIFNGGNVPFSTTTLATIGKAVVGVLDNLDATKNRAVKIHDTVITQNKLVEIGKNKDNQPWSLTEASSQDVHDDSMAKLKQGKKEDIGSAMFGFLYSAIFGGDEYGCDFSKAGGTDNELLGIPIFSEEDVEKVVTQHL